MEHNNNIELSTDEFIDNIQERLLSYIKKYKINFKKLNNTQKQLLIMKIQDDMWKDLTNKNDA